MGGCCGAMKTGQKSLPDKSHGKNSGEANQEKSNGKEPVLQPTVNANKSELAVGANEEVKDKDVPNLQEREQLLAPVKVSVNAAEPIAVIATEEEPIQESKNFMDLETSVVPFESMTTNEQSPPEAQKNVPSAESEVRLSYEIPVQHVFTGQQDESRQKDVKLTTSFPHDISLPASEDCKSSDIQETLNVEIDAKQSTNLMEEVIPEPKRFQNLELTKEVIDDVQPAAKIQFQEELELAPKEVEQKSDALDAIGHFDEDFCAVGLPLILSAEQEPILQPAVPLILSAEQEPILQPASIIAVCPGFSQEEQETKIETTEQVSLEAEVSALQVNPQELDPNLETVSHHQMSVDPKLASDSEGTTAAKEKEYLQMPEQEMAPISEPISKEPEGLALGFELNTAATKAETTVSAEELPNVLKPSEVLNASLLESYEQVDASKSTEQLEEKPAEEENLDEVVKYEPVEEFVEPVRQEPFKEVIEAHAEEVKQAPIVNEEPAGEIKQEQGEEEKQVNAPVVEQQPAEDATQATAGEARRVESVVTSLIEQDTQVIQSETQPSASDSEAQNDNALMDDWAILSAQEIQSPDVSIAATESIPRSPVLAADADTSIVSQIPEEVYVGKPDEVIPVTSETSADDSQLASRKPISSEGESVVLLPAETLPVDEVKENIKDEVDSEDKVLVNVGIGIEEPKTQFATGILEGEAVITESEIRTEINSEDLLKQDATEETMIEKEESKEKHTKQVPNQEQLSQEAHLEQADQIQTNVDISLDQIDLAQQPEEPLVKEIDQEQKPSDPHQEQQPEVLYEDQLSRVDVPQAKQTGQQSEDQVHQQQGSEESKQPEEPHSEQAEQEQSPLEQHVDQEGEGQTTEEPSADQVSVTVVGESDQKPVQTLTGETAEAEGEQTFPVLELVSESAQQSRESWWKESATEPEEVSVSELLSDQMRQARQTWWEEAAEAPEQPQTVQTTVTVEEWAPSNAPEPLVEDEISEEAPLPIPPPESQLNADEGVTEAAYTVPPEVVPEPLPLFSSADKAAESVPLGGSEMTDRPVIIDDSPTLSSGDGTSSTIPTENGDMSPKSSDEASTPLSPEAGEPAASVAAVAAAATAASKEPIPAQA